MTVNEQALAAFAELQEASKLIGREFEIFVINKATLIVLDVRMEIDSSCDYSITIEYEIWANGRMVSSGTKDYELLQMVISYDGK